MLRSIRAVESRVIVKVGHRVRRKDGAGEGNVVRRVGSNIFVHFLQSPLRDRDLYCSPQPRIQRVGRLEVWNHETFLWEPAE